MIASHLTINHQKQMLSFFYDHRLLCCRRKDSKVCCELPCNLNWDARISLLKTLFAHIKCGFNRFLYVVLFNREDYMYGGVTSSYDHSSISSYAPAPHRHRLLSFCVVVTLLAKKKIANQRHYYSLLDKVSLYFMIHESRTFKMIGIIE